MGTTVEKFNYAFGTKDLLKTEINKINNVLDDNSTFRSYPQELFNGYLDVLNNGTDTLWNNLEKVSQTGTEAVLENVETAPMKMVLNGNTSQETTTGKNLFDKNAFAYDTGYYNDSGVLKSSETTGHTTNYINIEGYTSYIISGFNYVFNNSTDYTTVARVYFWDNSKNWISRTSAISGIKELKFTTPTNAKYVTLQIGIQNIGGTVINNIFSDLNTIQLEQGSTATSYEPYTGGQPSPSPDYPQEVKVVKGENVVSVQGKQLFDYKDFSITYRGVTLKNENNLFSISGTAQSGYYPQITITRDQILTRNYWSNSPTMNPDIDLTKDLISFKDLTKEHVISLKNFEFEERAFSFIRVYYGEENFNSVTLNANNLFGVIPAGENIKGIGFAFSEKGTYSSIFNFQLEEGSTATPYVPYSKTDYPINLGDIELCKINTYKDYFHKDNGKWYVHKAINKIVLNGTENWNKSNIFYANVFVPRALATGGKIGLYSPYFKYSVDVRNNNSIFVPGTTGTGSSYIWLNTDVATTVADFKTWLSNNNVTLYYVLATPTEEEITNTTLIEQLEAISKAKSVKDKTYITQTNDELPFILDVEAIKEYEVN